MSNCYCEALKRGVVESYTSFQLGTFPVYVMYDMRILEKCVYSKGT
jgi:hypothetical protein